MRGDLSESQVLVVAIPVDQAIASNHQDADQKTHQKQTDMRCHLSGNCALRVCSGCGIISSTLTFNAGTSYSYSDFDYLSFYSTNFSPEIRPPISL